MKKENKKYYLSAEVMDEKGRRVTKKIEVSEQIYREYIQSVWREERTWKNEKYYQESPKEKLLPDEIKYAFDRKRLPRVVSLNSIVEAGGEENLPYEPDFASEMLKVQEEKQLKTILVELINEITQEEKKLYDALFVEGLSEREYARRSGIPQRTINDRKNKMLRFFKRNLLKKI